METTPAAGLRPTTGLLRSPALLILLIAMHAIVLYNAVRHNPRIGYDAVAHLQYINTLAGGHLPNPGESYEFFSPPLAYVFPALLQRAGVSAYASYKAAQYSQVFLSLLTVFFLLRICDVIWPRRDGLKLAALGMLAMLPVYYKTYAMIRGEPWVACMSLAFLYCVLLWLRGEARSIGLTIAAGFFGGLLLLARQWGATVLAGAVAALILTSLRRPRSLGKIAAGTAIWGAIAILIGGGFYLHLYRQYGSPLAFSRPPLLADQIGFPPQHLSLDTRLFTDPIRDSLMGEIAPIFYAEMWGDFEGHFLVWKRSPDGQRYLRSRLIANLVDEPGSTTNRYTINRYLGRVNLLSLLPTAILLAGLFLASLQIIRPRPGDASAEAIALVAMLAGSSIAGYAWFVWRTPPSESDTVKATYILQLFPLLAILAAAFFSRLASHRRLVWFLGLALLLIALHNLGACFTRYTLPG